MKNKMLKPYFDTTGKRTKLQLEYENTLYNLDIDFSIFALSLSGDIVFDTKITKAQDESYIKYFSFVLSEYPHYDYGVQEYKNCCPKYALFIDKDIYDELDYNEKILTFDNTQIQDLEKLFNDIVEFFSFDIKGYIVFSSLQYFFNLDLDSTLI